MSVAARDGHAQASRFAITLLSLSSLFSLMACPSDPPPPNTRDVGCEGCITYVNGVVFDGERLREAALVVEGERVREVVEGEVRVAAGERRDVGGSTLLPGLFDLHVHLPAPPGPYGFFSEEPYLDEPLAAMLRNGVTTALDLGSSAATIFTVRERSSLVRVLAAGPLVTAPGGHPCRAGTPPGDSCLLVEEASEVSRVEELLPLAPDALKIVLESGTEANPLPRLSLEAARALQELAEENGIPPIAHVGTPDDLAVALEAGIRRFAHLPSEGRMSAEDCDRLVDAGGEVIATLAVSEGLAAVAEGTLDLDAEGLEQDLPPAVRSALGDPLYVAPMQEEAYVAFLTSLRDDARANFALCRERGVRFVVGTDAGNPGTFHGRAVHDEVLAFHSFGMPLEEALAAATSRAAAFLGLDDGSGRLAPDAPATLFLVEGDLRSDPSALRRVREVLIRGASFSPDEVTVASPAERVEGAKSELELGEPCLALSECGSGLVCDLSWRGRCTRSCTLFTGCPDGYSCMATGGAGGCVETEGCDVLSQDCANGAACVWLGAGESMCWAAVESAPGDPCAFGFGCAAGQQCDFATGRCYALCDPSGDAAEQCGEGATCEDLSSDAGLAVGACRS